MAKTWPSLSPAVSLFEDGGLSYFCSLLLEQITPRFLASVLFFNVHMQKVSMTGNAGVVIEFVHVEK